jgi:hypothetical protein
MCCSNSIGRDSRHMASRRDENRATTTTPGLMRQISPRPTPSAPATAPRFNRQRLLVVSRTCLRQPRTAERTAELRYWLGSRADVTACALNLSRSRFDSTYTGTLRDHWRGVGAYSSVCPSSTLPQHFHNEFYFLLRPSFIGSTLL